MLALALFACVNDRELIIPDPPEVADPPADEIDAQGVPPADWESCGSGHYGLYYNLPDDHPDLALVGDPDAIQPDLAAVDYYTPQYLAFSRFDPSIDWGANWWPVDSGLQDDPHYFAVQYTSWIRVYSGGTLQFVVGAEDDLRVSIDGDVVYELSDTDYEPGLVSIDLPAGQFPVQIRYAQRNGAHDGFRFRLAAGDAQICWPYFPDEAEE